MHISPISYTNSCNNRACKTKLSFKAHPDFYKYNSTFSCYFRRGVIGLSCLEGYNKIENLFFKIFSSDNNPKKMLIAGIGNSQEPFSYLASIKGIIKNRILKNNVDLYTVDLQSKPERIELKKQAFCDLHDYQPFPKYAKSSFIKDSTVDWLEIKQEKDILKPIEEYMYYICSNYDKSKELIKKGYGLESVYNMLKEEEKQKSLHWRVNDEIFEFLEKTYNNPQKSKWDSRIQDVIKDSPDGIFDIISANNILPYILNDSENAETVKHIVRTLKPNGYFITEPYEHSRHIKELSRYDNIKKIHQGIYRKIS